MNRDYATGGSFSYPGPLDLEGSLCRNYADQKSSIAQDSTDLETVVARAREYGLHAASIEEMLTFLLVRLNGSIPGENACAASRPGPDAGLIGDANLALNEIETRLNNCANILDRLRGLV